MTTRKPAQLLLAFYGEMVMDRDDQPVPASLLLDVLDGAGIAPATTRATLNRMAHRSMLTRVRTGRAIAYGLTKEGSEVLREAGMRVNRPRPFDPQGSGWTLVTFSVPEGQRQLRHRLRATLTWAGFAPLRDGLWVAPGEVDLSAALHPLARELPDGALTGFLAREAPNFAMGANVESAWQLGDIRAAHLAFAEDWREAPTPAGATPALTARTALVADWLALLRTDPGLPSGYLGADWPSDASTAIYRSRHTELAADSEQELLAGMS
jgi:phenylacetic acid degradation operon negative regulatory protein